MKLISLLFFIFFIVNNINAQYRVNYKISVDKGFDSLKYGWADGFNCPQFSEVDLNNDGILDLVVFDRADNSMHTKSRV